MAALAAGNVEKRSLRYLFVLVLCDVFSKDTKCFNHFTAWFEFRCCYWFVFLVFLATDFNTKATGQW